GDLERRPSPRGYPGRRVVPAAGLPRRDDEQALAAHAARDHVRRVGRLLRPRAAAGRDGRRRSRLSAARVPRADAADLALRAPAARGARRVRPRVDPAADRVALRAAAARRARRAGREPRERARLLAPEPACAAVQGAAARRGATLLTRYVSA